MSRTDTIAARLAFVAVPLIAAATTFAAEVAEHGAHAATGPANPVPEPRQALITGIMALVVFAIAFFILATQVWPKIMKGLDDRATKIREEIAAAEAARRQAREALADYERSLAEARAESARMIEATRSEQAKLAADLRAKADRELEDLRKRALADIENAKRAALNEIYGEAVNVATIMASKILQREVSAQDQQRLIDESLTKLQAQAN